MSLFDLTGKTAVVTGSTQGIGRGIAEQLVRQGANVIVSSRNAERCEDAAEAINRTPGRPGERVARAVPFDLDDRAGINQFAEKATACFGRVDILVCNAAALSFIGPAASTPPERFDRLLQTNIHNNFRLCQAFRPVIAKQGGGSMILIGSLAGHSVNAGMLAYSVSKAGVAHMSRILADEFAVDGIRVNCVSPGFIRSKSSRPVFDRPEALAQIVSGIPLQRPGEPEDVAGAVVFLASRAGSYVTGETILVDGGRVNLNPPRPRGENPNAALRSVVEEDKG
ncbi:SDR family NAD(P)-dependent oxidoreductase [Hyphomonas oceanitis]|uniref:Short chain dehydrogenase/reductase family oxidoreductase n=1 Tax=Hyphomonas oceanitis SCH89 TaxID=1280953 RepID=A0A059G5J7_9PROT|nr:SDR family oxidoreductase [Hyphomonas oceanitis]KDA01743.1 short chain dehydrogenase/reductase family oxidoreductase [Hyphomonas oceanitis SCH89]